MPWFPLELYQTFRAGLEDLEGFPGDYNMWLQVSEAQERQWIENGLTVLRVSVNPEAFLAWCKKRFVRPNKRAVEVFIEDMIFKQ